MLRAGHADAGADHHEVVAAGHAQPLDGVAQVPARLQRLLGREVRQQHADLVATHAADHVERPHRVTAGAGERAQHGVARRLPERLVDQPQPVHVDHREAQLVAVPDGAQELVLGLLLPRLRREQAGELIAGGQLLEPRQQLGVVPDVVQREGVPHHSARRGCAPA